MANYRVRKSTVKWTPTGGSQATLTNVLSVEFGRDGQTEDVHTDGQEYVEEIALAQIKGTVSVTLADQLQAADLAQGGGALEFIMVPVKSGVGAEQGTPKKVAFAKAVLKAVRKNLGAIAGGSATLEFEAAATTGAIFTVTTTT